MVTDLKTLTIKNISFKLYSGNNSVQVFVYNPNFKKGDKGSKTVRKALSFFWGTDYRLQTDSAFWDSTTSRFFTTFKKLPVVTAPEDNKRLNRLYNDFQTVLKTVDCYTPDDFFNAYQISRNVEAASVQTVLGYAIYYRDLEKSGKLTENTTGNYRIYDKFVNKLQGKLNNVKMPWADEAKQFANMPIDKVDTEVFNKWCKFVAAKGLGYKDTVNAFRHMVYHYQRKENGNTAFKFYYSVEIDRPKTKAKTGHETLTKEQLNTLFTFDVSLIKPRMNKEKKQMFLHAFALMYGLQTRPCDVLSIKIEDIQKDRTGQKYIWKYCPRKMINREFENDNNKYYGVEINDMCLAIIQKYTKGRKSGFVLPFSCNQTEKEWQKRIIQLNHLEADINSFIQDIANFYNWDIKPTMYTLRHTIISQSLSDGNTVEQVASTAKTSIKQVEKTYMSKEVVALSTNANKAFKGIRVNI